MMNYRGLLYKENCRFEKTKAAVFNGLNYFAKTLFS